MPSKYRYRFGLRKGHWKASRKEAIDSAIKAGLGSYDEHPPYQGYLMGGVVIEESE